MILVDLNLLLYAVNTGSPHHRKAKRWLEEALSGDESVALPWVVLLGFLRITTNRHILPHPLLAEQALEVIEGWLALRSVVTLEPASEHWAILRDLLGATGTAGNLTTDAHLAAIAIGHGCELCSTDSDFGRFDHLRWRNPIL